MRAYLVPSRFDTWVSKKTAAESSQESSRVNDSKLCRLADETTLTIGVKVVVTIT